jgi:hypothetical protein
VQAVPAQPEAQAAELKAAEGNPKTAEGTG